MDFLIEKEKRKKLKDRRKKESLSVDFPQGRSLSPVRLFLCSPFGDKIKKTPVPFPYRRFFVS
ncbi:MAG: hypothetical protein SO010_07145 [Candidatus Limiplasma sp.]|nr:hypothetical protein [Candidatus Limiplasma sp.]